MSKLNHGARAHCVRMHNTGKTPDEIGDRLGVHPTEVLAFLRRRPGWPGNIKTPKRAPRANMRDEDGVERQVTVKRAQPSLPKLRFMGEV